MSFARASRGGFIAGSAAATAIGIVRAPAKAAQFEFKEFTGFYSPFDIRGTAFIIYRYNDAHREDDG